MKLNIIKIISLTATIFAGSAAMANSGWSTGHHKLPERNSTIGGHSMIKHANDPDNANKANGSETRQYQNNRTIKYRQSLDAKSWLPPAAGNDR